MLPFVRIRWGTQVYIIVPGVAYNIVYIVLTLYRKVVSKSFTSSFLVLPTRLLTLPAFLISWALRLVCSFAGWNSHDMLLVSVFLCSLSRNNYRFSFVFFSIRDRRCFSELLLSGVNQDLGRAESSMMVCNLGCSE